MGVLKYVGRGRQYTHELDFHVSERKAELPVENLQAVFMESSGAHPNNAHEIEWLLNQRGAFWTGGFVSGLASRMREIVERAKTSGTEIWLGDVESKTKDHAKSFLLSIGGSATRIALAAAAGAGQPAALLCGACSPTLITGLWLAREGNAQRRAISRRIMALTRKMDSIMAIRDNAMARAIQTLAKKTGHVKIGVFTGAAHVGIADILEKNKQLTPKQRAKIASRSQGSHKAYRCIYDKYAEKWRVEEHLL